MLPASCCSMASRVFTTEMSAFNAEPMAANRWELSGTMVCSSSRERVRMKALLNSDIKCRGPPKKATCPRMGLPQAKPLMVWFTTAWNIEAARSCLVAPSLIKGWISDLAKTPHRAAMGYRAL